MPTWSASSNGPIGKPTLNRIALSITSFGTPSSWWIHAASSMYGAIVRLVMKPGTSFRHRTDVFLSPRASASASRIVFALVSSPFTISIRGIITTGLKKCIPTTRSGRLVARPMAVMLRPLVFDARIARAGATASMSANTSFFTSRSSRTASMTTSASFTASLRSIVGWIRARAFFDSDSVICPFSTSFPRDQRIRSIPRSTNSCVMSVIRTETPFRADTTPGDQTPSPFQSPASTWSVKEP